MASAKRDLICSTGFTLVEVMLAVTILGIISLLTAQSIQSALQNKAKIQKDIDTLSKLRSAVAIMEKDIQYAFHHRDIEQEILKQIKKESEQPQQGENGGQPNQAESDEPDENNENQAPEQEGDQNANNKEFRKIPGIRELPQVTHFIGEADSLNFTSLNNVRTVRDSQESDQMEVGYYLESCRHRINKEQRSDCLWRRVSAVLDENVRQGGQATPILEEVKSLEFRYFGPDREDWVQQWRTDRTGDARSQGRFPSAVEIKMTATQRIGEKTRDFTVKSIAPIRFPNNPRSSNNPDSPVGVPTRAPNPQSAQ